MKTSHSPFVQPAATYREVRGLSRGLAVLRALNEAAGGIAHIADLARSTGIHRTTVKRLLETLKSEGLVHQKDDGSSYSLGFEVRRLSEGYIAANWVDKIAAPAMRSHLRALSWPSDLATPDNGFMIVRESTHRASMLSQHRATIGIRIPMLVSSLGRAWLSWCSDDEREATLTILRTRTDDIGVLARDHKYVSRVIQATRKRGYALNHGEWAAEASVIAIGFPIHDDQQTIGAINLVFQKSAVSERQIAKHYAPLLRDLASEISTGTKLLGRS
jgi:IclR family transcriptional regulator, mhp operon transcriptional activator